MYAQGFSHVQLMSSIMNNNPSRKGWTKADLSLQVTAGCPRGRHRFATTVDECSRRRRRGQQVQSRLCERIHTESNHMMIDPGTTHTQVKIRI
jgi:hypothetical protein